jgi:trehalose 6-phosphate phosphatase
VPSSELVSRLASAPDRAALVLDVDGTLAPIVPRPELAAVPGATRRELARLVSRYALVACLSGRPGAQAAALVGVGGIRYVGNHGLELHPDHGRLAAEIAAFRDRVAGLWPVEDKVLSLSFHYREAADEDAARADLAGIAERAEAAGLVARWGRKVLEVRPRVDADKGTAIVTIVRAAGVTAALYAGDDWTDLDAFRGLGEAGLDLAVRVAVDSAEAPPPLLEAADLVVDGPAGVAELLERL